MILVPGQHNRKTIQVVNAPAHAVFKTSRSSVFESDEMAPGSYFAPNLLQGTRYAIQHLYANYADGVSYSVAGIPAYASGQRQMDG
jgi:hypothetical protein